MTNDETLVDEIALVICSKESPSLAETWNIPTTFETVNLHREAYRELARTIIAALRAAGAIPADGMVVVDAKRWEDTSDMADALCQWVDGIRYYKREDAAEHLTADGMLSWDDISYAVDEFRTAYVGDLDAVPVSTEPPQAPAQTP